MPFGLMAPVRGEGGLVGDLEPGGVGASRRRPMRVVGAIVGGFLEGGHDLRADLRRAGGAHIPACLGDGDGFLPQADGKVPGDAGFEGAHGAVTMRPALAGGNLFC